MRTGKLLLTLFLIIGCFMNADAAKEKYQVVFENSSGDTKDWTSMLNNVENVRKSLGKEAQIEVVSHGEGLSLILATEKNHAERMNELNKGGVRFLACENTMQKKKVTKENLLGIAVTVDSGVSEVIRKQHEGWSYVKSGI